MNEEAAAARQAARHAAQQVDVVQREGRDRDAALAEVSRHAVRFLFKYNTYAFSVVRTRQRVWPPKALQGRAQPVSPRDSLRAASEVQPAAAYVRLQR